VNPINHFNVHRTHSLVTKPYYHGSQKTQTQWTTWAAWLLRMKELWSPEMSVTTQPTIKHHISKEMNSPKLTTINTIIKYILCLWASTGWSKNLCAPDDYSKKNEQKCPNLAKLEEGCCWDSMTCTRGWSYSILCSSRWVRWTPKTCRVDFAVNKYLHSVASYRILLIYNIGKNTSSSQNTFRMWTVLYRTRSLWTQFSVSINVWRLAGDTLNITDKSL
jgi:hypothetical protein